MLTRPFTKLVVAFGHRKVTQRQLVEELILGIWILVPLGFLLGLLTSRICTKVHFRYIRSDIWTTIVVFLIGDIMMEWLLPSLSCLPMVMGDDDYYSFNWLLQTYGVNCPDDFVSGDTLLGPDAMAILFSLRLALLCLGVGVGESLVFIALTGGIATGKSTVGRLLVENGASISTNRTSTSTNSSSHKNRPGQKKGMPKNTSSPGGQTNDSDKEGSVNLICADTIAHEILLPPSVLSHEEEDEEEDADEDGDDDTAPKDFIVRPTDSVFPQVLAAFEGHDILAPNGRIDRLKLGSIVFKDPQQRRKLNRITHPNILLVLVKLLIKSALFGTCDLTVADIPLLFESGKLSWLFAVTICVIIKDPSLQLDRLQKRNPEISKEECQARIDSQLPLERKAQMADIVIDNSGDMDDLLQQVENVRSDLMGRLYGIGMSLLQVLLLIGGSTAVAVSSKFFSTSS